MDKDYAFEMAVSNVRFGVGVTREVGADLKEMGARIVLVVTDPTSPGCRRCRPCSSRSSRSGLDTSLYDRVRVEPTDESFLDAIAFARRRPFDAFVAVGGGSTIDTAKAVNLYTTYPPADFLDYVNPPIGKGLPVPGPLKPLIAIPTTAGTGSETTGVAIFDLQRLHAKTGIANRRLKPTLGYLDPDNTRTMPPRGGRVDRARHPQPRHRVVHGDAVRPSAPRRSGRRCGRPIRARIRSATSGRCRRCAWSPDSLVRAVDDPATTRPGRRCCSRRRTPASASAMPACICRTACRIRCRVRCRNYRAPGYDDRSSAGAARHLGDPERARGLPLYRAAPTPSAICRPPRRSARTCRGVRAEDAGKVLADRITWFMQRAEDAERSPRDRLLVVRHSRAGRRHAAAASRDEAVAPSGRTRRAGRALRRRDGRMVTGGAALSFGSSRSRTSEARCTSVRPQAGINGVMTGRCC